MVVTCQVRSAIAAVVCAAMTCGCQTVSPYTGKGLAVETVLTQLKADVNAAQAYLLWAQSQPLANKDQCKGPYSFEWISVRVTLTVALFDTKSAKASATVPLTPAISILPGVSAQQIESNTQTLTFYLYPETKVEAPSPSAPSKTDVEAPKPPIPSPLWSITGAETLMTPEILSSNLRAFIAQAERLSKLVQPEPLDPSKYPITEGLRALRNGLVATGHLTPCFAMVAGKQEDNKLNSIEYIFGLDETAGATGEVKFLVFSVGGGRSVQNKLSNSILVSFRQPQEVPKAAVEKAMQAPATTK